MKFYVAGFGHRIENTNFFINLENILISYYHVIDNGCLKSRFQTIKGNHYVRNQTNGSDQSVRKRKKRINRKRNNPTK